LSFENKLNNKINNNKITIPSKCPKCNNNLSHTNAVGITKEGLYFVWCNKCKWCNLWKIKTIQ